jgi:hypothetical protein
MGKRTDLLSTYANQSFHHIYLRPKQLVSSVKKTGLPNIAYWRLKIECLNVPVIVFGGKWRLFK